MGCTVSFCKRKRGKKPTSENDKISIRQSLRNSSRRQSANNTVTVESGESRTSSDQGAGASVRSRSSARSPSVTQPTPRRYSVRPQENGPNYTRLAFIDTSNSDIKYDTVIRDANDRIAARVRFSELKLIPQQWNARYETTGIKVCDDSIMHSRRNPLQICVSDTGIIRVYCEFVDGSAHSFRVKVSDTIENIKEQIAYEFGFHPQQQIFEYGKKRLQSGDVLQDIGIRDKSMMKIFVEKAGCRNISVRSPAGNVSNFQVKPTDYIYDLKLQISKNEDVPVQYQKIMYEGTELEDLLMISDYQIANGTTLILDFRVSKPKSLGFEYSTVYRPGLNIIGLCPNADCPAKQSPSNGYVVQSVGYIFLRITPNTSKFPCPKCHPESCYYETTESMFTPIQFQATVGRAHFRFRGRDSSVTNFATIEANNPKGCPATLGDQNTILGYDFMEVQCVRPGDSFYSCVKCDQPIYKRTDESAMQCGHVFHKSCVERERACDVCRAPDFTIENLVTWCDSISCLPVSLILGSYIKDPSPRTLSSSTFLSNNNNLGSRLIHPATFIQQSATQVKWTFPNDNEWQQKKSIYIWDHLSELLQITNPNSLFLGSLHAADVLEYADREELNSMNDQDEKCMRLYEIIMRGIGTFDALVSALQETRQTEAVHLLMKFYESTVNRSYFS